MAAAEGTNGAYAAEEALFDLGRSLREAPTLPELPDFLDAEDVREDFAAVKRALREQKIAIATAFQLYNDRQHKIFSALRAMHADARTRHEELLLAIGRLAGQR